MDGDDEEVTPDVTMSPKLRRTLVALTPSTVKYIPASMVFEDRPFAQSALEDSGAFAYGDNDLSLVQRDKLIAALKELELQYGDEEQEVDEAIAFLETLPATMYIDLEDM